MTTPEFFDDPLLVLLFLVISILVVLAVLAKLLVLLSRILPVLAVMLSGNVLRMILMVSMRPLTAMSALAGLGQRKIQYRRGQITLKLDIARAFGGRCMRADGITSFMLENKAVEKRWHIRVEIECLHQIQAC